MLLIGCKQIDTIYSNFSLVRYKKVDRFYHYDEIPLLEYKGSYYVHKDSSMYKSSELKYIALFKTEGIIDYSNDDLSKDSLLNYYVGLNHNTAIHFNEGILCYSDFSCFYEKVSEGEFICRDSNYLYKFYIK